MTAKDKNKEFDIAYQNKDIVMKTFADRFKGKSLELFCPNLPKVKNSLETNLPIMIAKESRMDNLFLLEDNSYLIIDYESAYKHDNKRKYLDYIFNVCKKYMTNKGIPKVRLLIFYTTNKKPKISLKDDQNFIEMIDTLEVFLTDFDSDEIKKDVFGKINAGEKLKPEDLMKLIIFPMTYESKKKKVKAIMETLDIISKIKDANDFSFSLLGLIVFANQLVKGEILEKVKEMLDMITPLDEEYIKKYDKEYKEKFIKEKQKFEQNYTRKVVVNMVEKGFKTDTISEIMTDIPKKDIEQIIEELKKNNN